MASQHPPQPPAVPPQEPWSSFDEHLWYTCDILADLVEGRLEQRPLIATQARLRPGDRALAVGMAGRATWRAIGDGSYRQSSMFAFGSPMFVAGSMAANALGNAHRRDKAARDSQPRWVSEGPGEVTITRHRVQFGGNTPYWLDFGWNALDAIELAAPDAFQTSFRTDTGQNLTVRLHTPWASLMFALAAATAFPAHPRLLSGDWLPPGFESRCAALGRPIRPARQLMAGGGGALNA